MISNDLGGVNIGPSALVARRIFPLKNMRRISLNKSRV
jgi:hypothetical protein